MPEWQAVNVKNRSFIIGALVDLPAPGAVGVLFAHGTRFGGHALYVKDNRLHYVNSYVGIDEQMIVGSEDVPTGEQLILSASFEKEGQEPLYTSGRLTLYHADKKVAEGTIKTQLRPPSRSPAQTSTSDANPARPSPTTTPGAPRYAFAGGTLHQVSVNVSGEPYLDVERHAAMLLKHQ